MKKVVIFASGSGTNAENIIKYFSNSDKARVTLILSNSSEAYVIKRAEALRVPTIVFDRNDFYNSGKVFDILISKGADLIVLAGFLWLVPSAIINHFRGRIINIHPALLPAYGGKGMYGNRVHKAVIEAGETESGITIHHVNDHYDEGDIIFQSRCSVLNNDTPDTLAARIHALEHKYFPEIIESLTGKL
jgi:phosphoribosylglycinamide formyltransferase-1